jgi:hypothetical protein
MADFQNWSNANNLVHLPTRGAWFTWDNGRRGAAYTEKRLDRAICNHSWIISCSMVTCTTLVKNKSDHHPILLDFNFNSTSFASQFKFMRMWTLNDTCRDLIANCWSTNIVGSPMFILSRKLKLLKEQLKVWNKDVFGNVHIFVRDAEERLVNIQNQIQMNGSNDALRDLEFKAKSDLDDALHRENWFWQEKSRVNWHKDGDRNTGYFHRIAKIKNTTKVLSSLRVEEELVTDPTIIVDHIVNYYQNLFCTNPLVL